MQYNRVKRLPPPPRKLDLARVLRVSGRIISHCWVAKPLSTLGISNVLKMSLRGSKQLCDRSNPAFGLNNEVNEMLKQVQHDGNNLLTSKSDLTPTLSYLRRGSATIYPPLRGGSKSVISGWVRKLPTTRNDATLVAKQTVKDLTPQRLNVKKYPLPNPLPRRGEREETDLSHKGRGKKVAAFTLAEVLITLGIIGVVAAMTMPVLITKYQKNVMKTQFKKSYANITNTINFVQAKNGYNYECYSIPNGYEYSECEQFWNEVLKELKVIKTCAYRDDNCGVLYKDRPEVLSEGGATNNMSCSFLAENNPDSKLQVLNDGSFIILTINGGYGGYNPHHKVYFTLDVNGEKGPNKWGYDVFYLMLEAQGSTSNIRITDSRCALKEKGGFYASEMLLE